MVCLKDDDDTRGKLARARLPFWDSLARVSYPASARQRLYTI